MISLLATALAGAALAQDPPQTLRDWLFWDADRTVYAVTRRSYEEATADPIFDTIQPPGVDPTFKAVPAYSFELGSDEPGKPLQAAIRRVGTLKIYVPPARGLRPHAMCLGESDCRDGKDISAAACEPTQCRALKLDRPREKRAGTRLTAADLSRPLSSGVQEPAAAAQQSAAIESGAQEAQARAQDLDRPHAHRHPADMRKAAEPPPEVPPGATRTWTQIRKLQQEFQKAAARNPNNPAASGQRYVIVDRQGNIVALASDADAARQAAGSEYQAYRFPAAPAPPASRPRAAKPPAPPQTAPADTAAQPTPLQAVEAARQRVRAVSGELSRAVVETANAQTNLATARAKFTWAQRGRDAGRLQTAAAELAAAEERLRVARDAESALSKRDQEALDEYRRALAQASSRPR
ncbi:MAG: hypothetical protein HY553_20230 [Elusimicrobia bacterium]|nr:hypothetical protein [Elusimicrobiota bacterium]